MKKTLLDILKRFKLESISLGTDAAGVCISYTNWDKEAAWQMYVELVTRITTQPLEKYGDEKSALDSVYSLFPLTRDILKQYGKNARNFTKIAIIVLNQVIRPFTSKWHYELLEGHLNQKESKEIFRNELKELRTNLLNYSSLLADMAGVEDLSII